MDEKYEEDIELDVLPEENHVIVESKFQKFANGYLIGPWDRLSKQQKTLIIVIATGIIILGLIIAILIPMTSTSTKTRSYYIKAEEIIWNYTPQGENVVKGRPFNYYEDQYTTQQNNRIGSIYKKAQFVGYEDESFEKVLERPETQLHMGILGPVIRAEVGETILVTVVNDLSMDISFHINGLQYSKENEGIAYNDNITDNKGAVIHPNGNYTYVFNVDEADGPASSDYSTVAYNYYSTVDIVTDYNTGLCGVVVITKKGSGDETGAPEDVDYEGFLLASVFDETKSFYYEENIHEYLRANTTDLDDDSFQESNLMFSFNGYLYGNMPPIKINQGDHIRWYVCALGEGSHTLMWSGQSLLFNNARSGSVVIFPGTTAVADTVAILSGTWLIESYGTESKNGMSTLYDIHSSQ